MLVIVWVKLHYSNQPAEKQFQKLCDIMASELNNYPLPELAMAYDYYNNSDNTASFFRKIQKNKRCIGQQQFVACNTSDNGQRTKGIYRSGKPIVRPWIYTCQLESGLPHTQGCKKTSW